MQILARDTESTQNNLLGQASDSPKLSSEKNRRYSVRNQAWPLSASVLFAVNLSGSQPCCKMALGPGAALKRGEGQRPKQGPQCPKQGQQCTCTTKNLALSATVYGPVVHEVVLSL